MLKNKDPQQILAELERLDQQEFNINQPPSLNEKVLKDKRRKLTETWNRVLGLYRKEEPDRYQQLRRQERDYQFNRDKMIKLFEAVKSAQDVVLDEIPLPVGPDQMNAIDAFGSRRWQVGRDPPGCPPGIPPKISDLEMELASFKEEPMMMAATVQAAVITQNDDDVDQFLKEIEHVQPIKPTVPEPTKSIEKLVPLPQVNPTPALAALPAVNPTPVVVAGGHPSSLPFTSMPTGHYHSIPPPTISSTSSSTSSSLLSSTTSLAHRPIVTGQMTNVSGMTGSFPVGIPSIHSIHSQPSTMPAGKSIIHPYKPSATIHPPRNLTTTTAMTTTTLVTKEEVRKPSETVGKATIEAKPQLRNLSADATRFLPVSLRVKRPETKPKLQPKYNGMILFVFN